MNSLATQPGSSWFSNIGGWALTSCKDPGVTDTNKNKYTYILRIIEIEKKDLKRLLSYQHLLMD
jgi:hypothetical protein